MVLNFYPRSPRGERRDFISLSTSPYMISIHAPREGSDFETARHNNLILKDISIHAPREGSDPDPRAYKAKQRNFYPRSPRGERQ